MLEKMYLIEIVRKMPTVLGPYSTHDDLRRAHHEATVQGREVYAAEVFGSGVLHVRRLFREEEQVKPPPDVEVL